MLDRGSLSASGQTADENMFIKVVFGKIQIIVTDRVSVICNRTQYHSVFFAGVCQSKCRHFLYFKTRHDSMGGEATSDSSSLVTYEESDLGKRELEKLTFGINRILSPRVSW